jgi:intracellular sulfur oxidation DsrE/DsrF family protein
MKSIKLVVAGLGLLASLAAINAASAADAVAKVVIQVSDADAGKWNLALNNAKNVQSALGADKVDVEIVAYGPGIGMLKMESPVGNRVDEAKQSGVAIVACQNTMKNMKLTSDDMLPNTSYVPAGVVELINKQKEGYAYIRP